MRSRALAQLVSHVMSTAARMPTDAALLRSSAVPDRFCRASLGQRLGANRWADCG